MSIANKWLSVLVIPAALLAAPRLLRAGAPAPVDAVKELTSAMTAQHLEVIAAPDPSSPNRYVAAMLISGTQLLVVSAEYPNPSELQALLSQRGYRDVYSALHQPSTQATRLFFIDAGCDGMQVDKETVDVAYEKGANEIIFDGDWRRSKMSQSEYQQRVQQAAVQYSRLVTLLRESLPASVAGR